MKKVMLYVLFFPLFVVPLAQARWSPGENLLTSFWPPAGEWEAFEKHEAGLHSSLWERKGRGRDDCYAVTLMPGVEETLSRFREVQDAPGKSCDTFGSDILNESPVNGYPRLMWRTQCGHKDGFRASILHVAIQGRDSLYYVQKIWRGDVSEPEMALWQERLSKVSVCDTRDPGRPCPEGFERVR